jgi:hypothetical protein
MTAAQLTAAQQQTVQILADIQQRIAELTDHAEALKDQLRAELGRCTHQVGDRTLSITPTRRFDPHLAKAVIPNNLLPLCTATIVDGKRAKATLPPALYAACQVESDKLTVRLT